MIEPLFQVIRDRLVMVRLRRELRRFKADDYDRLLDSLKSLRRVLETQQRAQEDLHRQLEQRDQTIEQLRKEYTALKAAQASQEKSSREAVRIDLFRRLQPIITQLPTLQIAVEQGADITAHDVLGLLAPFNQMIGDLGFERIGQAGVELGYDPRQHKPVGRGAQSVVPNDLVRVRYVGYRYGDQIVCKAEVTRIEKPVPTSGDSPH